MNSRKSANNLAMNRNARLKGIFAGVVILLCVAFVTWAVWPTPPVVIPQSDDPAAQWLRSYGDLTASKNNHLDPFYMANARITVVPNADRSAIVIAGRVTTPAELNLLKSELAKITPAVPLTWEVNVAP